MSSNYISESISLIRNLKKATNGDKMAAVSVVGNTVKVVEKLAKVNNSWGEAARGVVDSFEKTAEEPICASCSERIETVHYRHHSGNGYLYDPSAQCRKFWCIISRYNGSYYDDCSWNRILRFKKSPEERYFTDLTDWNISFSRINCV